MEREAERTAFGRAWRYLNFNATAKWVAMVSAVGTAVLYVALLVVLWLFADLMVFRGQIPAYQTLVSSDQVKVQQYWVDLKDAKRKELLADIGLDPKTAEELAVASGDSPGAVGLAGMPSPQRNLVWRALLFEILRSKVSGPAAVLVLPAYRDLPENVQAAFADQWKELPDKAAKLQEIGFTDTDSKDLAAEDPRKMKPEQQELAWQANILLQLRQRDDAADVAAANFLEERLRREALGLPSQLAEEASNLDDRGILSLIVRTHVRNSLVGPNATMWERMNPYQISSSVLGTMAWWKPWMWKWGSPTYPNYFYYLTGLLIAALVLVALRGVLAFLMHYFAALTTIEASTRLRRAVYHHAFRLGTLAFRALGPGEAVTIFTRHVEAVHDGLYTWLTVLFYQPVKFALLLVFALIIQPWLALAFLMFALLVWMVGGQIAVYFRKQERAFTTRASEQLTLIRESLMLMRLVKVYLMELFNQNRVERQLARHAGAQLRRYRGEAVYQPILVSLGLVAGVLLLFVAGLIVLNGQLAVASAITLATALVSLYWPLKTWLENQKLLRRGREAAVTLFKFLDRPGEVGQVVGAEFLPPMTRELEFDGVSLREPGTNRPLLQNVSLTIKAGQQVAVVGTEDLEKHALVYLIPRFLDPAEGEIRIDQHNLRWVTLDSLRAQAALVMQHSLVFHDTVANNIGCGDPAFTRPQIMEAAKLAHAHHFIQKLPKGYETTIGELGQSLTTGQKYQIALARAILRDPAILIIEEPETSLDEDTRDLLDDTFARILPGRTTIFLPRRFATLRGCDLIFLLDGGRLVARGDHQTLWAQSPHYRRLLRQEYQDLEVEERAG